LGTHSNPCDHYGCEGETGEPTPAFWARLQGDEPELQIAIGAQEIHEFHYLAIGDGAVGANEDALLFVCLCRRVERPARLSRLKAASPNARERSDFTVTNRGFSGRGAGWAVDTGRSTLTSTVESGAATMTQRY
jgi:hypothetical protein